MQAHRSHRSVRSFTLVLLTFPVVSTGACLDIAQRAAIQGFFNVITPLVVDDARRHLGLPPLYAGTTTGGQPSADEDL